MFSFCWGFLSFQMFLILWLSARIINPLWCFLGGFVLLLFISIMFLWPLQCLEYERFLSRKFASLYICTKHRLSIDTFVSDALSHVRICRSVQCFCSVSIKPKMEEKTYESLIRLHLFYLHLYSCVHKWFLQDWKQHLDIIEARSLGLRFGVLLGYCSTLVVFHSFCCRFAAVFGIAWPSLGQTLAVRQITSDLDSRIL